MICLKQLWLRRMQVWGKNIIFTCVLPVLVFSCTQNKKETADNQQVEERSTVNNPVPGIGDLAPDFSLPNPEGEIIRLSDYRGKYLYLDFWASWCQPCRHENPALVAVYKKYKSPDFDMLAVAFDRKREKWLGAIEEDSLPWKQVSDLKYFDSELIDLYQIQAIPSSFLLDKDGIILAKNIRSQDLEKLLKGIFARNKE